MTYSPNETSGNPTPAVLEVQIPEYSNWPKRVGAYIIDGLVIAPFITLAVVLGEGTDPATGEPTMNAMYWLFMAMTFALNGYNRWYLAGRTGQSWGRKALAIRLVGERSGQPIGPLLAFARDLAHIVDSIPCNIGYLIPLWDAKGQTLADKIVRTVVVD